LFFLKKQISLPLDLDYFYFQILLTHTYQLLFEIIFSPCQVSQKKTLARNSKKVIKKTAERESENE